MSDPVDMVREALRLEGAGDAHAVHYEFPDETGRCIVCVAVGEAREALDALESELSSTRAALERVRGALEQIAKYEGFRTDLGDIARTALDPIPETPKDDGSGLSEWRSWPPTKHDPAIPTSEER